MMTEGVSWPLAYGAFMLGMGLIGGGTYLWLRYLGRRHSRQKASMVEGES
jgi:magnesium transporter